MFSSALVKTQYPIQKSFSIDEDDDIEETVDVDAMVKALRSKGQDISIIICNNQPYMDPEVLEEIAAHLLANKNIRHLSLANCNVSDSVIDVRFVFKYVCHQNICTLKINVFHSQTLKHESLAAKLIYGKIL